MTKIEKPQTVAAVNEYQHKLCELCARHALSDWLSSWRIDDKEPLQVIDAFVTANNINDRKERIRELERVWDENDCWAWEKVEDDHCSDIIVLVIQSYTSYLQFAEAVKALGVPCTHAS